MSVSQLAGPAVAAEKSRAEISIVIVNWNAADYLRDCITSIYEHTRDTLLEIIVVDNASSQPGVDDLKEAFPEITLIKSPENLGFARANNLAFKHSSGSCVLFLNPDTRLVGPAIQIMLAHLRSLPQAGIVGCRLLNSDLSLQTSCIQKFPTILNQAADIEYLRLRWPGCPLWAIGPLFSQSPQPTKVEVISGACMMTKREVLEAVGLFSEGYFMYAEDLDLCYKVKRAGFDNYYLGDAVVIHHGGKSTGQRAVNDWATRMKFKAILQFCRKTRGPLYAGIFRVAIGMVAASRLLLIALAFPFVSDKAFRPVFSKWRAILKWAAGFEAQSREVASNS